MQYVQYTLSETKMILLNGLRSLKCQSTCTGHMTESKNERDTSQLSATCIPAIYMYMYIHVQIMQIKHNSWASVPQIQCT